MEWKPERPISPVVDWIVTKSGLNRTGVDNMIRGNRHNQLVEMALNGDLNARAFLMKAVARMLGDDRFANANTCEEIMAVAEGNAGPLTETAGGRPFNTVHRGTSRKPSGFHRARKPRTAPAKLPRLPLDEWLVQWGGLPGDSVKDFLAKNAGNDLVRMADDGDFVAKWRLAGVIGKMLGIPAYETADSLGKIMSAGKKNRERPLDEAAGENVQTYYRGFNAKDSGEGDVFGRLACPGKSMWISPYIEYAIQYASNFGKDGRVAKLAIDDSKLKVACLDDLDELGYSGADTIDIGDDAETLGKLLAMGKNAVTNYLDDSEDGYCIFDPAVINSVKVLSPEELARSGADTEELEYLGCLEWYRDASGKDGKPLVETVCYRKGHKDSKGEAAPWVIISCKTGKILSSHKSKEKAEEHLRQMEYHKHAKAESLSAALKDGYATIMEAYK